MVVRMRHTRAHTANRRSHHALKSKRLFVCAKCKAPHIMHTVCMNCGTYRGRQVIDVMAKKTKLAKKKADARKAKKGTEQKKEEKGEKSEKGSKKDA